jgi:hypothetical protein
MRLLVCLVVMFGSANLSAQILDSSKTGIIKPVKVQRQLAPVEKVNIRSEIQLDIFGEYQVTHYAVLSRKTPSIEELNLLVGSLVKVQATSITGTVIDPVSFQIFQVERLRRDDFIYRVFGREIKAPEPDLPNEFNVHKTDHENCYGIVEISATEIAIPYKGVLLYLKKITPETEKL